MNAAVGNQIVRDAFSRVDGNRETDSRSGSGGRVDCGVDADDFTVRIDKRAAGISAVDGSVGLNRFVNESGLARLHSAADRANNSRGERTLKTERISDGENFLADLNR